MSRQIQTGSVPPWLSPQDVRADDVDAAEKRIKNEHVRGMVANSPTMETLMETRRWLSKLSAMKESRSPRRILMHGVQRHDQ
jgi:hypothetical protein